MEVGARVRVKDGIATGGGCYGQTVERHDLSDTGFKVRLDGETQLTPYAERELLPVEVVVLEGKVHRYAHGPIRIGSTTLNALDETLAEGNDVRITIERVKAPPQKEENGG